MLNGFKKIALAVLFFLISFFIGTNIPDKKLEDFFFYQIIGKNPDILTAQISYKVLLKPRRNPGSDELDIEAVSAISIYVSPGKEEKILFKKEPYKKLPIASLTKLMTALVSLDFYDSEQKLEITETAIYPGSKGQLLPGNILSVEDLLYIMLVESSNEAAKALAEGRVVGEKTAFAEEVNKENAFISLMNEKAESLRMKDTYFINSSGLDPVSENPNISTAEDLSRLAKYLIFNHSRILEITKTLSYGAMEENGSYYFSGENINTLLKEIPEIIGGKTGYTKKAGGCILLILKAPQNGYIINIVLGAESSQSRFIEMKKLINWVNNSYDF